MDRIRGRRAAGRTASGPERSARGRGAREAGSRPGFWSRFRVRSVALQVFGLQVGILLLLMAFAVVELLAQVRHDTAEGARDRSQAAAEAFAHSPGIVPAL